ncbi:RagB/SusD family nutrient uptake outer membrane protein [Pontibacter sp. Tf4]|uniref:RagB/SusD family nutrient uptake outer membrane protein n=1 Tax=Pontibacter sp. Tf4 TaxID=2761620 RepID=UPI0016284110|nr:RagB/SusD family nutrient uptake outer membrane protein [Pontibacter sp. Tf4]MBB6610950.1 RagB/SusD family nutrient uptake outer membrane protein [Pontibacter sp. Tf4]
MKSYIFKIKYQAMLVWLATGLVLQGCEVDNIPDPNNPTVESVLNNATVDDLNNLVVGTEAGMRNFLGTYYDNMGVIGREHYRFSSADPRFTADLLGKGSSVLDNNTFYTTNPWAGRYRVVKNTNILIASVFNTTLITEEQRQGYLGFAKTIKAHQLLMNLTMMWEPGIRIDVDDPDNLGPFVERSAALDSIALLLEEGAGHLAAAGEEFPFSLSEGFAGFNDPAGFLQFNRALAARVAVYNEEFEDALGFLEDSFLELNTDFNKGVYYVFSASSGDVLNPVFVAPNSSGEIRIAHPSFIADIAPNDDRRSKVLEREEAASLDGLTGKYDVALYKTNTDPIPIIRNEELILIYAEANIQTGNTLEAVRALNIIRQGHGLGPYAGSVTQAALIDEMLEQRRYSLYFEGHRWVDMRRYGRLNELPLDRPGDDVWTTFPKPFIEEAF